MSHVLHPSQGHQFLAPIEVVRRLRDEFASCEADAEQGSDDVGDMIAKLIELKAPQAIIDSALKGRERAVTVIIADDTASQDYLRFMVQPNEGILIGYYSEQHEAATRKLLERCALVLGYEIKLV